MTAIIIIIIIISRCFLGLNRFLTFSRKVDDDGHDEGEFKRKIKQSQVDFETELLMKEQNFWNQFQISINYLN